MFGINNYDPNEELPSPSIEAVNRMLNFPSFFDLPKPHTPPGMNPSNQSSLSSPPQSTTSLEIFRSEEHGSSFDSQEYQLTPSFGNLGDTLPNNEFFEATLINSDAENFLPDIDIICDTSFGSDDEKLRIVAQPKAFYRERYSCEIDPKKNRAQRYIRAEDDSSKYEYPTVKIPPKWCDPTRQIFIRVTPVTIESLNAPHHCIHPYEIDTQETNVIKDPTNNSLYFRVNETEFETQEKSFHISRKKMIQTELRAYGSFRLFCGNEADCQRVKNPLDAKQKIAVYQLWKSQFVFTIAERYDNNSLPVPIFLTSVASQIMVDEAADGRYLPTNNSTGTSNHRIKCIPQKGDWQGGDEVILIWPSAIKKKVFTIDFDFGQHGQQSITDIAHIDTKTILFRTPSCPLLPGDENVKVSIIIKENSFILTPIDFCYVSPIRTTMNICPRCQDNLTNSYMNNKRRCDFFENDGGESLVAQMNHLSIGKGTSESLPQNKSDEKNTKFEKYLSQLRVSLDAFVRTNDPSRLFRRTRVLLSTSDEQPPPLIDAIQRGHTQLALALIEQVMDMSPPIRLLEKANDNGETPLLIAAKVNQWKLIEIILNKQPNLVQQKDKNGNNFLHLLANLVDDKSAETIENVLKILPNESKLNLLKDKNKAGQTPTEIAQRHDNIQCINLFKNN